MPVYDIQTRLKLRELGYDPDQVDELTPENQAPAAPEVVDQQNPTKDSTSVSGVVARSAARSVLPTAVGVGASVALSPFSPFVAIPGGLGAAALTDYVQNKVLDSVAPSFQEQQQQDISEHPYASVAGSLIPQALAMRPSIKNLGLAAKALTKPLTGVTANMAEKAAAANVALGAGLPAAVTYGQEAYHQDTLTPKIDPIALAMNVAGGALMNKPTPLGKAMGLHDVEAPKMPSDKGLKASQAKSNVAREVEARKNYTPLSPEEQVQLEKEYQISQELAPENVAKREAQVKANETEALKAKVKESKRDEYYANNEFEAQQAGDAQAREAEKINRQANQAKAEADKLSAERERDFQLARLEEIKQQVPEMNKLSAPEATPESLTYRKKPLITEEGEKVYSDNTDNLEEIAHRNKVTPPTEAEQIQDEYDRGIRHQAAPAINKALEDSNLSATPSARWIDYFKKLGAIRGVKVESDGTLSNNGEHIAGKTALRDGIENTVAKFNPTKAGIDTIPHELGHVFVDDLIKFGGKNDNSIAKQAVSKIAQSSEFKAWRDGLPKDSSYAGKSESNLAEEFLQTKGGEDVVRRLLGTDNKGKLGNFASDFWSHIKHKFGAANDEDYVRLLSNKLLNDRPFSESVATKVNPALIRPEEINTQDKSRIKTSDQKNLAPATPHAYLESPKGTKVETFNLTEDIEGHPKGSTVSRTTLEKKGYTVPDNTEQKRIFYADELNRAIKAGDTEKVKTIGAKLDELDGTKLTEDSRIKTSEGSAIKTSEADEPTELPKRIPGLSRIADLWRPEIEKIRHVGTEQSVKLADALSNFYEKFTEYRGKLSNDFNLKMREVLPSFYATRNLVQKDLVPELKTTWEKMNQVRDGKKVSFSPEEDNIRGIIKEALDSVRETHKTKTQIAHAPSEDDPNYVPHVTKPEVIQTISKNPYSSESLQLKKDFIRYQRDKLIAKGSDPVKAETEAASNFDTLIQGYSKKNQNTASQYGPIDKSEGLGLPESWREQNPINAMNRYLERASRRFAYADSIEGKADIAQYLKEMGSNESVKTVVHNIEGIRPIDEAIFDGAMGVVRSGNLGTLTGSRDLLSTFTLGMQHQQNPLQTIKAGVHALSHLSDGIANGYKSGRIRLNMNELEWGDSAGNLRKISDTLSTIQARNWLEKVTRGVTHGIGEFTALDFHEQYLNGNLTPAGEKFFKDFGKDTNWQSPELSNEDLLKISSRFVDSVQGTYDYRGLPKIAVEGQISPILKLARWNIEKSNNFQKHVLTPATQGNFKPLMMATLGMFIGGEAVNQLTQLVTGRKEKTAKASEIIEAKKMGNDVALPTLYKALGLASASGYAGMMGDVLKSVMDRNYAKIKPRWYNNMLIETGENLYNTLSNMVSAAGEDGLSVDLALDTISSVIQDTFQGYRLALSHLGKETKEQIEHSNKTRDLRTFNLLEGNKVADLTESSFAPKFQDKKIKEFKKEKDLSEAAKELPQLLRDAIEKAEGDPDKLKANLTKLKTNSYQTMPNPKRLPTSFARYLLFLKDTQGTEEAQKRLADYLQVNAINKAKSSLVP